MRAISGLKAPGSCESASSDSNSRVASSITCRSIGSLALAIRAARCCSRRLPPGELRPVSDASDGRWRSSSSSRSRACSSSGLRRRVPSLRTARAAGTAFARAERHGAVVATAARAVGGARHARQQRAERAGARRLRRREAAEGRAGGQDHRPIGPGLHAGALEPGRCRRPGVLQQPGDHAGGGAQHDRALDLRGDDGAGRVPQGRDVDQRPERVRFGVDVLLSHQRRGEGLQLAQLPFRGAVDQLHRPRDLDVDLDPGFVHQLEAAQAGARSARRPFRAALRFLREPASTATRRRSSRTGRRRVAAP